MGDQCGGKGWVPLGAAQLGDKAAAPGATCSLPSLTFSGCVFQKPLGAMLNGLHQHARGSLPSSAQQGLEARAAGGQPGDAGGPGQVARQSSGGVRGRPVEATPSMLTLSPTEAG